MRKGLRIVGALPYGSQANTTHYALRITHYALRITHYALRTRGDIHAQYRGSSHQGTGHAPGRAGVFSGDHQGDGPVLWGGLRAVEPFADAPWGVEGMAHS